MPRIIMSPKSVTAVASKIAPSQVKTRKIAL